jgi:ABC-type polysaccharide/polyol phosphate export permease
MVRNLYIHRRYLFGSFWTEFRFRYAGTVLGVFWFIVNPLLEVAIYSLVFSYLIGIRSQGATGVSYTLFLMVGLMPWLSFSTTITRGSNALNSASTFLRRLAIPTDIFVAKETLISMLTLLIYVVILIPINLLFSNPLSWSLLVLPILIFLFIGLGFGLSLSLSHLRVLFPDIGEVLGVLVQLWRWTLPINYSLDILPDWLAPIFKLNPPYYFIVSFRDVFLEKRLPSLEAWLYMVGWVVIFGLLGSFVSRRLSAEVKDQM